MEPFFCISHSPEGPSPTSIESIVPSLTLRGRSGPAQYPLSKPFQTPVGSRNSSVFPKVLKGRDVQLFLLFCPCMFVFKLRERVESGSHENEETEGQ